MLTKGFEIETYTGKFDGEVVGLSDRIVKDLEGFEREPDSRNVEYITPPVAEYAQSACNLLRPKIVLRKYLEQYNYTLIPGSTLPLGGTDQFYRSFPNNPYHDYIEKTYGTKVVTASIHINVGISEPEALLRACRVIRMEAPLYLALTASSPFRNNEVTGFHSTRWMQFPKTHQYIPIFSSHAHYISWIEEQLEKKTMQNVRHLWASVRPNGNRRPYDLNRLELRICDLVSDTFDILAITALLEARILEVIENPEIDPLFNYKDEELVAINDANEKKAAEKSLDAQLHNWESKKEVIAKDWIMEQQEKLLSLAWKNNFADFLEKIPQLVEKGNEAQRWLELHRRGFSIQEIVKKGIMENIEKEQQIIAENCCDTIA